MIELNLQLCEELDLTYWQLNPPKSTQTPLVLKPEEMQLLTNILQAKNLDINMLKLQVLDNGVVSVKTHNLQLLFNDVTLQDTNDTVNLAKLADMLYAPELKKHTWFKLKQLNL